MNRSSMNRKKKLQVGSFILFYFIFIDLRENLRVKNRELRNVKALA
jgi:hypothetical protein